VLYTTQFQNVGWNTKEIVFLTDYLKVGDSGLGYGGVMGGGGSWRCLANTAGFIHPADCCKDYKPGQISKTKMWLTERWVRFREGYEMIHWTA